MSGLMHAYGAHEAFGSAGQGLGRGKREVRVYNPNGKGTDRKLHALLRQHVSQLTTAETTLFPSCAEARKTLADRCDPKMFHRICPGSSAFATTMSVNYVAEAHSDSGARGVLELIQFSCAQATPPAHKWLFAIAGSIVALPNVIGRSLIVALPAEGVFHGTLPTSSDAATLCHGNYGSALITKANILRGLTRELDAGHITPARYRSSLLYAPPSEPGVSGTASAREAAPPTACPVAKPNQVPRKTRPRPRKRTPERIELDAELKAIGGGSNILSHPRVRRRTRA